MPGRALVVLLMVATITVPLVCGVLSIVLDTPMPILWAVVPTLFLAIWWYAAEVGHRKAAHPSRVPGATAHPRPDEPG